MPNTNDSQRFERTRSDHATETAEDYVEAILDLIERDGECRITPLAEQFGVTHVTASKIIRRLSRDGLVIAKPREPITLTAEGRRLARHCRERHDVVYRFLLAIGVGKRIAAVDTEGIEHHVSPQTLKRMRAIADSGRLRSG
ncbi:MAG: manganese-binding transcriptional regulator MntR [Phycisphaerales bacterium]